MLTRSNFYAVSLNVSTFYGILLGAHRVIVPSPAMSRWRCYDGNGMMTRCYDGDGTVPRWQCHDVTIAMTRCGPNGIS